MVIVYTIKGYGTSVVVFWSHIPNALRSFVNLSNQDNVQYFYFEGTGDISIDLIPLHVYSLNVQGLELRVIYAWVNLFFVPTRLYFG